MHFRFKPGLLGKLAIAAVIGVACGFLLPAEGIRALNTFKDIFGQFVKFLVPLIIIGFVTPAIAETGKSAGRLLLLTTAVAYASTLFAGAFAFFTGRVVFPAILTGASAVAGEAKTFAPFFTLKIPPVADVVTTLAIAFTFGIGIAAVKADAVFKAFRQVRSVVAHAIEHSFVPLLPVYIMAVVAELAASGRLSSIAGPCVKIMCVCTAFTVAILLVQYTIAGIIARRNPLSALKTMLPAYFTGWGSCSSAATLPVTLRQTKANGVSESTADLVIPLCANIHLAGSMSNMVAYAMGLIVLAGEPISGGAFLEYILMMSIIAVASPGVPGGCVLAAAPLVENILGFTPDRYALMVAIYMALDGMGTACNLTGDGAIAIVVDRFNPKNHVARTADT